MPKRFKKEELNKTVTLGVLLEYTDEFLIPRMSDLMDEKLEEKFDKKLAVQTHELKDYVDKKLANSTAEIFQRLDRKYGTDKQFKTRVIELFKKHKIGAANDWNFLEGLMADYRYNQTT